MTNVDKLMRAIKSAAWWHRHQKRDHGVPYINHCIEVTNTVANYTEDTSTLCCAILHDCIEDTDCSEEHIKQEFGSDVLLLVKQLTNDYPDNLEHSEKMLAVAKHAKDIIDPRAQLIKLADRLCNLNECEAWKPRRIAKYLINTETLLHNLPIKEEDKVKYWHHQLTIDILETMKDLLTIDEVIREYNTLCLESK